MARNVSSKFDVTDGLDFSPAQTGQEVELSKLVPYHNHQFSVYTGDRLNDMVESVRRNGVLVPIIVRKIDEDKYEILAGHNRVNAAKIAGLFLVPAIIKENLSDAEAEMYVVETNAMQRGFNDLSISEQAAVVALRHSKMFDEQKRRAISEELNALERQDENGSATSKLAATGEEYGLGKSKVARLIRIHKLLSLFSESKQNKDTEYYKKVSLAVNEKKLSIRAAVELSYIPKPALEAIFDNDTVMIDKNNVWVEIVKVSDSDSQMYRAMFKNFSGKKSDAKKLLEAGEIAQSKERTPNPYKIKKDVFKQFFTEDDTADYINGVIQEALEKYFAANPREEKATAAVE